MSRKGDWGLLKRGLLRAAVWVGLLCITTACNNPARLSSSSEANRVQDSRPKVLTTFTILADMARNVAGERLQVESITKPGAEIHGYEFTPSDIERAAGADLIVENGLGLELWARRFTQAAGDVPTVTLTDGVEPMLIGEDAYAGKPNPHAWMSPRLPSCMSTGWLRPFQRLILRERRLTRPMARLTKPSCSDSMLSSVIHFRICLPVSACW